MSSPASPKSPSYAEVVRGVLPPVEIPSDTPAGPESCTANEHKSISATRDDALLQEKLDGDKDSESAAVNTAPVTRARATRRSTRASTNGTQLSTPSRTRSSRTKKSAKTASPPNTVHTTDNNPPVSEQGEIKTTPTPPNSVHATDANPPVCEQGGCNTLLPAAPISGHDAASMADGRPVTFSIPLNGTFDRHTSSFLTDIELADGDAVTATNGQSPTSKASSSVNDRREPSKDHEDAANRPTIRPHPTLGFPSSPPTPEIVAIARRKVEQICADAIEAAAQQPQTDEDQDPRDLVPAVLSSDSELSIRCFVDDEAEESDDAAELGTEDHDMEVIDEDDYDRDDPFINDDSLSEMDVDDEDIQDNHRARRVVRKRKRRVSSKAANLIVPSDSESDTAPSPAPRRRRLHDSEHTSGTSQSAPPEQSLIEKRVQELLRREVVRFGKQKAMDPKLFGGEVPLPEGLSDEDRRDAQFLEQIRAACEENTRLAIEKANRDAEMAFKESLRLSKVFEGMATLTPLDQEEVEDSPSSSHLAHNGEPQTSPSRDDVVPPPIDTPTPPHSDNNTPSSQTVVLSDVPVRELPPIPTPAPAHSCDPSPSSASYDHLLSNVDDPRATRALLVTLLQKITALEGSSALPGADQVVVPSTPSTKPIQRVASTVITPPPPYPSPQTPSPATNTNSSMPSTVGRAFPDSRRQERASVARAPSVASTTAATVPATPLKTAPSPTDSASSSASTSKPSGPRRAHQVSPASNHAPSTPSTSGGPRRTFRTAAEQLTPTASTPADMWSLPGNLPPAKIPAECIVSKKYPYGPFLQEHSHDLPKLTEGCLVKWSDSRGPGYFIYERWGDQCPDLDFDLTTRAALFRRFHNCASLTREDPSAFTAKRLSGKPGRYHLYLNNRPALCFTLVYTTKSVLIAPEGQVLRQKYILGIPMIGDFHRLEAALCMIFHQPKLSAQLGMNALQFATKVDFTVGGNSGRSKSGMFADTSSRNDGNRVRDNTFTLDNTADVPVYDLRGVPDFNFDTDLAGIHRLPRFQGEIPDGSCVSVAYTVSTFITKGNKSVGLNIQFALVLGTPVEGGDADDDGATVEVEGDTLDEEATVSIAA